MTREQALRESIRDSALAGIEYAAEYLRDGGSVEAYRALWERRHKMAEELGRHADRARMGADGRRARPARGGRMNRIILPAGVSIPHSDGWERVGNPTVPDSETFRHRGKGLVAIRGRELGRWHLSVSHRERVPTWGELGFARDTLIPADVWMMVPHPPRKFWLNLDRRVLHLWEFNDPTLIEQFRWEGEQAQAIGAGVPDDGGAT